MFSKKTLVYLAGGYWSNTTHDSANQNGGYWSISRVDSTWKWYILFNSYRLEFNTSQLYAGMTVRAIPIPNTSKSIFLQAGGCWNDNSHDWIKKNGYYWTTKYDPSTRWVQTLFLNSTNLIITIQAIFTGFSIRPVR